MAFRIILVVAVFCASVVLTSFVSHHVLAVKSFSIDQPLDMPIFDIKLNTNLKNVGKEEYATGTLTVKNAGEDCTPALGMEFRGRGNSSWRYNKKGYRIKLETAYGLLGEGANRHWVIGAEATDPSFMRNRVAYGIAREVLDGIEYTTTTHFIEVWINGDYRGVYQLYEHVRVGGGRVPVSTSRNDVDTGYLVEINGRASGEDGIAKFFVDGIQNQFEVHSPDADDWYEDPQKYANHPAQVAFIRDYIQQTFDAMRGNDWDAFTTLADVQSFVDLYVLLEFFKCADTGYASFYMYKKAGGKLYAGPAWDFDLSIGTRYGDVDGLVVGTLPKNPKYAQHASIIYHELRKHPEFNQMVHARWQEVSGAIKAEVKAIISKEIRESKAMKRNNDRWGNDMSAMQIRFQQYETTSSDYAWKVTKYAFANVVTYPIFAAKSDYKGHMDELKSLLSKRAKYLDKKWA